MKRKIFKQMLSGSRHEAIKVPSNARILTVRSHRAGIAVWYLADDKYEDEGHFKHIWMFVDNESLPEGEEEKFKFICTVEVHYGRSIFHIFEKEED